MPPGEVIQQNSPTTKPRYLVSLCCRELVVVVLYVKKLVLYGAKLLNVNRLHHLLAICYRRLLERLTAAQFFHDAGFLKFTFELLEGSFDKFAFFYLYDDHI